MEPRPEVGLTWQTEIPLYMTLLIQRPLIVHNWICRHLRKDIVSKVRGEVDSVMTTAETRVQDALLTAIENLLIPRVKLAMKSVNASSGREVGSVVLDSDQRDFSGNIESLRMTASSRTNSHKDLNRINETRCNITVEGGRWLVGQRKNYWPANTHSSHSLPSSSSCPFFYSKGMVLLCGYIMSKIIISVTFSKNTIKEFHLSEMYGSVLSRSAFVTFCTWLNIKQKKFEIFW